MSPNELKNATLTQLCKTRKYMSTSKFLFEYENLPYHEKRQVAKTIVDVEVTRRNLIQKKLAEIREQLNSNQQALIDSINSMNKALANLSDITTVINFAKQLIQIVRKIISPI